MKLQEMRRVFPTGPVSSGWERGLRISGLLSMSTGSPLAIWGRRFGRVSKLRSNGGGGLLRAIFFCAVRPLFWRYSSDAYS